MSGRRPRVRNHIGHVLTALRDLDGVSQRETAEAIGVSRETVRNWERGRTSPTTRNLAHLAEWFTCDWHYTHEQGWSYSNNP